MSADRPRERLDKWLWQARFFKTRTLAAQIANSGKLRLDGVPVAKAARLVGPGDVLTFPQGNRVRVIRITALAARRGPASEAQMLYADLTPEQPRDLSAPRPIAGGRPDKRTRRKLSQALE